MSTSLYQGAIVRLNKDKASVQKQIAAEQERIGKLRRDAAKLREEAAKTKSGTMEATKRRQAESKERDLATAERRLAGLLEKKSKVETDLVRNLNSLQRAQRQVQRQQDIKDKRRRDDELRHAQQVAREVERQARVAGEPAAGSGLRRSVVMSVSSESDSEGGQGSAWVAGAAAQGAWPIHFRLPCGSSRTG